MATVSAEMDAAFQERLETGEAPFDSFVVFSDRGTVR